MNSVKRLRNNAIALNVKGASPERPVVQNVVSEIFQSPSNGVLVIATRACDGCARNRYSEGYVRPSCTLGHFSLTLTFPLPFINSRHVDERSNVA